MEEIYLARVTAIEKVPTKREGVFNQFIRVTPIGSVINSGGKRAYAPSTMPFTEVGGGMTSIPNPGTLCIVLRREHSEYDQILTYQPHEAIGPEGLYNPEEPEKGATVFKVGGEIKSSLILAPGGIMSLYSSPFAFLKLNGTSRNIDVNINTWYLNHASGYENIEYAITHPTTGASKIAEYKKLFSKANEQRIFGDWDLETESCNTLGASIKYNDKVIIRAGTIYNYDANIITNKAKAEVGHVYQIETRQNTISSNEKDTISIIRLGYQKENMKYQVNSVYPAGTIIEMVAKRVDNTPVKGKYSSYLMRYGKLEGDTTGEVENTKGEIYRLQMYNDVVDPIGLPAIDPIGKGKGWKYEKLNLKATEQYTESFGLLVDKSFYRKHVHAYPALTKATLSTYSGTDYTLILGGDNDKREETIIHDLGKQKLSLVETYKDGTYSFTSKQFEQGEEKSSESITIAKDNFEINVTIDTTTTYKIKLGEGKITIKLDTGDANTTSVELSKEGKIVISPGSSSTADGVYIGGNSIGQQLVTKSWLDMIFANHVHPTTGPGAPTLPPTPLPLVQAATAKSHTTFITKVE